ncbi:tRNA (adenine(22)-N(1))-methyltransferase [Novipirellula galeiformis]|uniref:tRNA (Adenine(22)-N(1))-methyltransferase n=1 Tax=Novipirellula galeiformis TaxID=2528004 RepID=A0A5C6C0A4_9BACT|nr:class I SAM-dependent methyltransferase [Novipirellula galeiformis]TWU17397.1 tRNA (adenine(22)-N(1))-methyltransferase [Novipirellula galeiformis]
MPKLDIRLKTVASLINPGGDAPVTHGDIGSDHGGLLVSLLRDKRIARGIAVENKPQPYENSCQALTALNAEVRFGDGLAVIEPGELSSLSICGMGAESIVKILEAFPDRVPDHVILQPNRQHELVRQWGLRSGFHLHEEQIAWGHWPYAVISLQRAEIAGGDAGEANDPAYADIDHQAAILFGPLILKRWDPKFAARLREEAAYLRGLKQLSGDYKHRLQQIQKVLAASP